MSEPPFPSHSAADLAPDPAFDPVIPREVLDRDDRCDDPSRYVREGEPVLDLGGGG